MCVDFWADSLVHVQVVNMLMAGHMVFQGTVRAMTTMKGERRGCQDE